MRPILIAIISVGLLIPAYAKNNGKGHGGEIVEERQVYSHSGGTSVQIHFSNDEQRIIREYYKTNLPPGLAKKGKIPPGWQKKIGKGQRVPEDTRVYVVPFELERKLPPLPQNYIRVMVGTSMVIKNLTTGLAIDACLSF